MNKPKFLPVTELQVCRDQLWDLFQKGENEAKTFCIAPNEWIPVVSVNCGGPSWGTSGDMKIPVNKDDLGVIFHELFHPVFHKSPLWHNETNKY